MSIETNFTPPEYQDGQNDLAAVNDPAQERAAEYVDPDVEKLRTQREEKAAEQIKHAKRRKDTFRVKSREARPEFNHIRKKLDEAWGLTDTFIKTANEKEINTQAIIKDMRASGIENVEDWKQAGVYGKEKHLKNYGEKVDVLLRFLVETPEVNDKKIEHLLDAQENGDSEKKLKLLLTTNLSERLAFFEQAESKRGYDYLVKKLDFYYNLVRGSATRKRTEKIWDNEKDQYFEKEIQEPINFDGNVENIRLGLLRDTLYAAMIGTPELASYIIASQLIEAQKRQKTVIFPILSGYHSGVFANSIGNWETLITEYQQLAKGTAKRNPDVDPDQLEHLAVSQAAHIFAKSNEYNLNRSIKSPYLSGFRESVAWAQLGEKVQAQLRGMRRKIQDVDLHNIGRFIGKSGENNKSYGDELKELNKIIRQLEHEPEEIHHYYDDDYEFDDDDELDYEFTSADIEEIINANKQKSPTLESVETTGQYSTQDDMQLINKIKEEAISRANIWLEREKAIIEKWWTKSQKEIAQYYIGEEERAKIEQKVSAEHENKLRQLQEAYDQEVIHLNQRSPEQIYKELKNRRETVRFRYEKRKSLAAKAIDLHFVFDEYKNHSPYSSILDWINEVPFGTIKRAHRKLVDGASQEGIIKAALNEILFNSAQDANTQETLNDLLKDSLHDNESKWRFQYLIKIKLTLGKFGIDVSFAELQDMAGHSWRWLDQSLAVFTWEETKFFLNHDLNLSLVPKINKVLKEHDIAFDLNRLVSLCKRRMINSYYHEYVESIFSQALDNFTLNEVEQAMDQDVDLTVLTRIKELLNSHEVKYTFDQLIAICANICTKMDEDGDRDENTVMSYMLSLQNFGFDTANEMLDKRINFEHFAKIQSALSSLNINLAFQKTLAFIAKVERAAYLENNDYFDVDSEMTAMRKFIQANSFAQLEELYEKGIIAEKFVSLADYLTKKQVSFDFAQIEALTKYCHDPYLLRVAVDKFGLEQTLDLAQSGVNLDKALQIKKQMDGTKDYERLENIIPISHLVKNDIPLESYSRAINNGFTFEELERYPFLISNFQPKGNA